MPDSNGRPAVIVLGGGPLDASVLGQLPAGALVIAADSGAGHAAALGITPDLVVGDLDSIDADVRRRFEAAGVPFDVHPADKDATDGYLAIRAALRYGAQSVTLVTGGSIDRVDHLLAVVGLLAGPVAAGMGLEAFVGRARLRRARPGAPAVVTEPAGHTVTLLAMFGPVSEVRTVGLHWSLDGAVLPTGSTRGVSNLVAQSPATVSVGSGTLLVITPEALG